VAEDIAKELLRLRRWAKELDHKAFRHDDIVPLLKDVMKTFASHLVNPTYREKDNKWTFNFGLEGLPLIMVERVHKGRDAIPQIWRKRQINAIEEILDAVEAIERQKL
jgi:hypothetical protein